MDPHQYLILTGCCVLITLPLEVILSARVYRRPLRLALAVLPTLVVFIAWDLLGIARSDWDHSPTHTTGIMLGPMPLEELVFLVIPICGLLTHEGVGHVLRRLRGMTMPECTLLTVIGVIAVALLELLWLRTGILRTLVDGWLRNSPPHRPPQPRPPRRSAVPLGHPGGGLLIRRGDGHPRHPRLGSGGYDTWRGAPWGR
ncbi:MAG: lycopene cyclase domain-containing protein [Arachnia propionica]|uniref:lycopene cyclase domain-containing protein n=1 Tax=Arachnia propionica TaxID=1750 RepID=UPI0026F90A4C|nr:lycopene cyclase domain-containing protein [Arachnia propionica]